MYDQPIELAPTFEIPTADYPFIVREVEVTEGQYGDQFQWTLSLGKVTNIEEEVIDDKTIRYYTPVRVSTGNKLGKFATALGLDLDGLTTGQFIGKRGTASVVYGPKKNGEIGNTVAAITPARVKGAAKAAAPVAALADDGDPF